MDIFEEGFHKLSPKVCKKKREWSIHFVSVFNPSQSQNKLEFLRLEVRHNRDEFIGLSLPEQISTLFTIAKDLGQPPPFEREVQIMLQVRFIEIIF